MKNSLRMFLLGCLLLVGAAAQAQNRFSGVVLDSLTKEPLAFASVFLANTTFGSSTTDQGKFEISRVPNGTYDMVCSYVGYRLSKQSVTMSGPSQQFTLLLSPVGNSLGEVVIKPEPNKPEEYKQFSDLFLGGSQFSEQCHVSNPEAVRVFFDEEDKQLRARAKEYLQVDNDALGYRLKYFGLEFSYDPEDGSVSYYGQPVFEEMKPKDEAQQRLWAANRLKAYNGSFMHFLRSVYRNRLRTENFMAQQIKVTVNKRFGQTDSLRQMLLERHPDGSDLTKSEKDSLRLWSRSAPIYATLNPAALPIDSIRQVSADGKRVFLNFTGELQVAYFGEAPDPRYKQAMSPLGASRTAYPALREVSRLRLNGRRAEIQADGSLLNPLAVSVGEYWGFEKIGEFLPFDYVPTPPAAPPGKSK
ncbi:carboxypeptidase-like regulatory domain-containing protein [Hymenobacter sp. 15J16-1T3B]|uniref:carboxypeptidase-like regulatory domain-containing protein n=1 Tax=Hymenobacter sp. 15J16-1T3B TaxID=2886941 RepID=UPI001D10B9C3|nr:carboxypeptidase-like regulatory domain-containing protein [Hymenobacter sp. 15J16-1T3B]MCC3157393.1 carboxypeptidase-like regulatory domain-containing protein [Hymenobacter sp. 15J16-1T3B]